MNPAGEAGREPAHRELGLTDSEYDLIREKMGRDPNGVELAMFSLLWSEHCSYKHSRKLLGQLPTEGPHVVMGPGENAGAVDVGNGYAIAFKVESHNHPSAVDPFNGAATGVGGVMRDILALGARPIAALNSMRFGEPGPERTRELVNEAIRGIAFYGNGIGVPTVGGEIYFDPSYEQNPLVNAMCLGLFRTDELIRSAATGPGNKVVLFGALTGRDGIGGASVLASAELDEEPESSVPAGDPAEEKKILECCQQMLGENLVVALQDLGAAGLTSAAGEMASGGGTGIEIDVSLVPLRDEDMEPFEIMVSESQERMLAVVEPGDVGRVEEICRAHGTRSAVIGEVTDTGTFRILNRGERVGEIEIDHLVDECPLYDLDPVEPDGWIYGNRQTLEPDAGPDRTLLALLASPSIASKKAGFTQFDSEAGDRTLLGPGRADAAVLRLPESDRAIATAIDGNGRRVACDPRQGTIEAVLECAANLACVGAEPLGVTNGLNFGNPEKPEIAWQLTESVAGLAEACRGLEAAVVGGNVSLYNETASDPILPTPIIGMVGEVPDPDRIGAGPWRDGDTIAIVGPISPSLAGSELARLRGELDRGLPEAPIQPVRQAIELVRNAVRSGAVRVATDVSDGGIATAITELALAADTGATVDLGPLTALRDCSDDEALFGEGPGGFIVAGDRKELERLGGQGVNVELIGTVGGDRVELTAGVTRATVSLTDARDAWNSLTELINQS